MMNVNHWKILKSGMFNLDMFSAPITESDEMKFEFYLYGLLPVFTYNGLMLSCQIITSIDLGTFMTLASVGFIFNLLSMAWTLFRKCRRLYKLRNKMFGNQRKHIYMAQKQEGHAKLNSSEEKLSVELEGGNVSPPPTTPSGKSQVPESP